MNNSTGTKKKPGRRKTVNRKKNTVGAAKASGPDSHRKTSARKWSQKVNETSDAMDLKNGVFKGRNARRMALSLKRSVESSHRRKAGPFASAMSMLNFYINRGGKNLSAGQLKVLGAAKDELRKLYHKAPGIT